MNELIGNNFTYENPPIQFFIRLFRNLPDGLMQSHGISISFQNENIETEFFQKIRKVYRAQADWLFYYFGNSTLAEELTFTDKNLYKSEAEERKAWINIIQEIFLLSPELKEFKNPGVFWILIETERFESLLKNSGLCDKPNPTSKNKKYKEIIKTCKFLENTKNLLTKSELTDSPTQHLYSIALKLCEISENYSFRQKWHQFLRSVKRANRTSQQSPLNVAFLSGNEIKYLKSGRENFEL